MLFRKVTSAGRAEMVALGVRASAVWTVECLLSRSQVTILLGFLELLRSFLEESLHVLTLQDFVDNTLGAVLVGYVN